MKSPVVLDLETKYTFRDFADHKKLGISIVGIYDYAESSPSSYLEDELTKLYPILENASYLIGFNIRSSDMRVLSAYYPGDIEQFAVFDILDDIRSKIGRRISLNDVISTTLEKKKSGHGLMAIDYYKEGKIDELRRYCMDDVNLTRELFDYGVHNGRIYYKDERGKQEIVVDWQKYLLDAGASDVSLSLPF